MLVKAFGKTTGPLTGAQDQEGPTISLWRLLDPFATQRSSIWKQFCQSPEKYGTPVDRCIGFAKAAMAINLSFSNVSPHLVYLSNMSSQFRGDSFAGEERPGIVGLVDFESSDIGIPFSETVSRLPLLSI
jgi:hypothetical protein